MPYSPESRDNLPILSDPSTVPVLTYAEAFFITPLAAVEDSNSPVGKAAHSPAVIAKRDGRWYWAVAMGDPYDYELLEWYPQRPDDEPQGYDTADEAFEDLISQPNG